MRRMTRGPTGTIRLPTGPWAGVIFGPVSCVSPLSRPNRTRGSPVGVESIDRFARRDANLSVAAPAPVMPPDVPRYPAGVDAGRAGGHDSMTAGFRGNRCALYSQRA